MNTLFKPDRFGNLYEVPRVSDWQIQFKRDQADELYSKARQHREWMRQHRETADEYERMAKSADSIADTWQAQHDAHKKETA